MKAEKKARNYNDKSQKFAFKVHKYVHKTCKCVSKVQVGKLYAICPPGAAGG